MEQFHYINRFYIECVSLAKSMFFFDQEKLHAFGLVNVLC